LVWWSCSHFISPSCFTPQFGRGMLKFAIRCSRRSRLTDDSGVPTEGCHTKSRLWSCAAGSDRAYWSGSSRKSAVLPAWGTFVFRQQADDAGTQYALFETSSARTGSGCGASTPRPFAVPRLMTKSYFVGRVIRGSDDFEAFLREHCDFAICPETGIPRLL
jgi:hypothetical protein